MKKIYNNKVLKFLFPIPSICTLVIFGILISVSEINGEPATIYDKLLFMIIIFVCIVIPLDIIILIYKKAKNYIKKRIKSKSKKQDVFMDADYSIIDVDLLSDNNSKSDTKNKAQSNFKSEENKSELNARSNIETKKAFIPENSTLKRKLTVDSYFEEAGKFIIDKDKASIGMIQRYFRIGFNRACRIMDQLCDAGVIGQEEGTRPRKILMNTDDFQAFIENNNFNYKDFTSIEEQTKISENNSKTIIPERIYMYNNKFDYMTGHDFEYFCANLLQKNGFQNITVTQGSGDHGVDILAEKTGVSYAIQCKCYSKDIGNTAVQQVHAGKSIYKRDIAVVLTNRFFTPQAKEEAAILGVKLWDRDILIKLINNSSL